MGWNPAVGQRVRIVSRGAKLPADRMTGTITTSWWWTRGAVRPFLIYDVRLDRPYGVMRHVGVTREALEFVPGGVSAPHRKKTATKDSTRRRARA